MDFKPHTALVIFNLLIPLERKDHRFFSRKTTLRMGVCREGVAVVWLRE